ncbi:MAG: class I SAM-dependent methyltransferase [Spirochaetaceae bacterium]|nr:class I SAM-dependent methyltransferase [Spirochaetaceae bacterium]
MNIEEDVKRYYDRNTRRFITFGEGAGDAAIHRAVHHPDAVNPFVFQEGRILEIIRDVKAETVIDLGCGIGSSLIWLADRYAGRYYGITLSPRQAEMAKVRSAGRHVEVVCGSYLDQSSYNLIHYAAGRRLFFGIESWLHCADPRMLFRRIAENTRADDVLVFWDDFRTPESSAPSAQRPLKDFREGWHAVNSLLTRESDKIAEEFGFVNILDQDHTQWLGIDRIRDRIIAGAVPLLRPLRLNTPWWQNLLGGNALRILLKNAWINYRLRAWKKTAT